MGKTFETELSDLIGKWRDQGATDEEIISALELHLMAAKEEAADKEETD